MNLWNITLHRILAMISIIAYFMLKSIHGTNMVSV
jgi:hypothetical protein